MKRTYKKGQLFDVRKIGQFAFMIFVLFIAFRILTPPSNETARLPSPDGTKTARLRTFYYNDQPSYKIYYRETDHLVWLNLLYLPSYTNTPANESDAALQWSQDSSQLDFLMNGTTIWHHVFE